MPAPCIVLTTTSGAEDAERIAQAVLAARLAACVQIQDVASRYWWDGAIARGDEKLLLCKTLDDRFERLRDLIVSLHPYDTPEILRVPVTAGLDRYLAWLDAEMAPR